MLDHLLAACRTVVDRDRFLLEHSASERAICHRLAVYLEGGLRDAGYSWDVDCEYNRVGAVDIEDRVKRLRRKCPEVRANNVAPDVIVHRRGKSANELAVEVKLLSTSVESDIAKDACKLGAYMDDPHLRYQEAAFVLIVDGVEPGILTYRRSSVRGRNRREATS